MGSPEFDAVAERLDHSPGMSRRTSQRSSVSTTTVAAARAERPALRAIENPAHLNNGISERESPTATTSIESMPRDAQYSATKSRLSYSSKYCVIEPDSAPCASALISTPLQSAKPKRRAIDSDAKRQVT